MWQDHAASTFTKRSTSWDSAMIVLKYEKEFSLFIIKIMETNSIYFPYFQIHKKLSVFLLETGTKRVKVETQNYAFKALLIIRIICIFT
jgi:hypothetical protein